MTPEEQKHIELEMIYEPYSSLTSYLEVTLVGMYDERECRRGKNHDGRHASGFGSGFVSWARYEDVAKNNLKNLEK